MQLLWDRFSVLPRNIIFVEVVHRKVPYVHDTRCHVTSFDRDPARGCIVSVTMQFGFMEDPNVERNLETLARHHDIDVPADPQNWIVHATQENVMLARGAGMLAQVRLRLFALLRQIATPAYYYYGLGDEVQLATEIMPVRLR
jgi:KUP system potassium uptake protein